VKSDRPRSKSAALSVFIAASLFCTTGCGGALYALSTSEASSKLEMARALGAERHAPYEYWLAKAHLDKAMEEASTADYGDAIQLADAAEQAADKAVTLSRQAHQGAGR
jgi:hypothetical protein